MIGDLKMVRKLLVFILFLGLSLPVSAQNDERFGSCTEGDVIKAIGLILIAAQNQVYDDPNATLDEILETVELGTNMFLRSCEQVVTPTATPTQTTTPTAAASARAGEIAFEFSGQSGQGEIEAGLLEDGAYIIAAETSSNQSMALFIQIAPETTDGCETSRGAMFWPETAEFTLFLDNQYTLVANDCAPIFLYVADGSFTFRIIFR
jgi:hypothetical protein